MDKANKPETMLPTKFGTFKVRVYEKNESEWATAIISGETEGQEGVAVRIHSACITGESFASIKCDCKDQLDLSLKYIEENGGVIIYLQQEGRGIGLGNKIRAYALQEQGHDTVAANLLLGYPADLRTYTDVKVILDDLGIKSISLLTNNPDKVNAIKELGIRLDSRIPVLAKATQHSAGYLEAKRVHMGHMMELHGQAHEPKRPFVHVNFAIDHLANYEGLPDKQFSCLEDWRRVHLLREAYSAVAVGAKTWIKDNPRLTVRKEKIDREPYRQPDRVIFAGNQHCTFTPDKRRTFIVGKGIKNKMVNCIGLPNHDYGLKEVLHQLRKHQITSLLVEGGPTLIQSFLDQNYVDLFTIYVAVKNPESALLAAKSIFSLELDHATHQPLGNGILLTLSAPFETNEHTIYENSQEKIAI